MTLPGSNRADMDVWAIIPVKSLVESKRRLAHLLSVEARADLMTGLLDHVLTAVTSSPLVTQIVVISSDPRVWDTAAEHDAMLIKEPVSEGLNEAVANAYELAQQSQADVAMVLPADLPLVTTADIELLIEIALEGQPAPGAAEAQTAASNRDGEGERTRRDTAVAICSDRKGEGTNALLLHGPADFHFHYGERSLQKHIREALERGYVVHLVNAPGLQFDLDTEEDWHTYIANDREKSLAAAPTVLP